MLTRREIRNLGKITKLEKLKDLRKIKDVKKIKEVRKTKKIKKIKKIKITDNERLRRSANEGQAIGFKIFYAYTFGHILGRNL